MRDRTDPLSSLPYDWLHCATHEPSAFLALDSLFAHRSSNGTSLRRDRSHQPHKTTHWPRMNTTALLIAGLVILPAVGLLTWVWLTLARIEEDLRYFNGFEGLHFEG